MILTPDPAKVAAWHARSEPLGRSEPLTRTGFTVRAPRVSQGGGAAVIQFPERKTPRYTGFSPAIKVMIRVRAGNGDVKDACCEACGRWLGRHGGQIQHRKARKAGGTSQAVISSVVNGGLLCGTPFTGCHGQCERRDQDMHDRGWWLEAWQDPVTDPVTTYGNTEPVYLLLNGTYGDTEPDGGGAA